MNNPEEKPKIINDFLEENNNFIEFEDEARRLIIKELGFEPNREASFGIELLIRSLLNNLKTGKISKKNFNEGLAVYINAIRGMIKRRAPEQVYLLEKKRPSVSYLYLGLGFLGLCLLGVLAFFWFG